MNTDIAVGAFSGFLIIIVVIGFVTLGMNLKKAKIRENINLCGHTIECYERVVFDGEEMKNE